MNQELADPRLPLVDAHAARRLVDVGAPPALREVVGYVCRHRPPQSLALRRVMQMLDLVGHLAPLGRSDAVVDFPPLQHQIVEPVRFDRPRQPADLDVVQRLADGRWKRRGRHEAPVPRLPAACGRRGRDRSERLACGEPPARFLDRRGRGGYDRLDMEERPVGPRARLGRQAFEGETDRGKVAHRPPAERRGREAPLQDRLESGPAHPQVGVGAAQGPGPLGNTVRSDLDQKLHARLADHAGAAGLVRKLRPRLLHRARRVDDGKSRRGGTRAHGLDLEAAGDLPDALRLSSLEDRLDGSLHSLAENLVMGRDPLRRPVGDGDVDRRPAAAARGMRPGEEVDDSIEQGVGGLTRAVRNVSDSRARAGRRGEKRYGEKDGCHGTEGRFHGGTSCSTGVVEARELYSRFRCEDARRFSWPCRSPCSGRAAAILIPTPCRRRLPRPFRVSSA